MEGGSMKYVKKQQVEESKSTAQAPLKVLILSRDGLSLFRLDTNDKQGETKLVQETEFPSFPTAQIAKFAPYSGSHAAIVDEIGIHFIDMTTGKERLQIVKTGISAIDYSPKDTYLITCERYQQGEKNLNIWNSLTGKEVGSFEWKKTSKEGPKSVKFTKDEKFCGRLANHRTIEIYEDGNFTSAKYKLIAGPNLLPNKKNEELSYVQDGKQKNVFKFDGFQIVPQNPDIPSQYQPFYVVAWQNTESLTTKLDLGNVYVFDILASTEKPKFTVQCSKAQETQVRPSPTGYAILVWSQNYVDSSGKSYYGEHSLQYIQLQGGKYRGFVPVFDAQIHDLVWSPSGDHFIVISGMQPATATLYDKDSNPIYEFGKRYRNTIRICPFSNGTLIGGFGNLAGEVDFWSLDSSKEIGKTKAYCTVSVEWAADGKHVMTAVLHERVKVDNEVKIFKANGQLLTSLNYKDSELYDAQWQPHPPETFSKPDLKQLGVAKEDNTQQKPKKLYKPPGGSNSFFQQMMRQEMSKTNEKGPRKLESGAYDEIIDQQKQEHYNTIDQVYEENSPAHRWRKNGEEEPQQQPVQYQMEEKKLSKHAKRRAKKKVVVTKDGAE